MDPTPKHERRKTTPEEDAKITDLIKRPEFEAYEKQLEEMLLNSERKCSVVKEDHRFHQGIAEGIRAILKHIKDYRNLASPKPETQEREG